VKSAHTAVWSRRIKVPRSPDRVSPWEGLAIRRARCPHPLWNVDSVVCPTGLPLRNRKGFRKLDFAVDRSSRRPVQPDREGDASRRANTATVVSASSGRGRPGAQRWPKARRRAPAPRGNDDPAPGGSEESRGPRRWGIAQGGIAGGRYGYPRAGSRRRGGVREGARRRAGEQGLAGESQERIRDETRARQIVRGKASRGDGTLGTHPGRRRGKRRPSSGALRGGKTLKGTRTSEGRANGRRRWRSNSEGELKLVGGSPAQPARAGRWCRSLVAGVKRLGRPARGLGANPKRPEASSLTRLRGAGEPQESRCEAAANDRTFGEELGLVLPSPCRTSPRSCGS
jgi:hypothetical protein